MVQDGGTFGASARRAAAAGRAKALYRSCNGTIACLLDGRLALLFFTVLPQIAHGLGGLRV